MAARVSFHQDLEPPREERFLKGTEPVFPVRLDTNYQKPRIVYPAPDTLISLDPEIPEDIPAGPFPVSAFHPPLRVGAERTEDRQPRPLVFMETGAGKICFVSGGPGKSSRGFGGVSGEVGRPAGRARV